MEKTIRVCDSYHCGKPAIPPTLRLAATKNGGLVVDQIDLCPECLIAVLHAFCDPSDDFYNEEQRTAHAFLYDAWRKIDIEREN